MFSQKKKKEKKNTWGSLEFTTIYNSEKKKGKKKKITTMFSFSVSIFFIQKFLNWDYVFLKCYNTKVEVRMSEETMS